MGTKFLFQKRKDRKLEGANTLSKMSVFKISKLALKPQQFYYKLITKIPRKGKSNNNNNSIHTDSGLKINYL